MLKGLAENYPMFHSWLATFLVQNKVTEEVPLDPSINKTKDVWHIFVEGEIEDMLCGYKFDGKFYPEEGHYFDSSPRSGGDLYIVWLSYLCDYIAYILFFLQFLFSICDYCSLHVLSNRNSYSYTTNS